MEMKIFDVEHGFCAIITADNGRVLMIDCGVNNATGFRPSDYLVKMGCHSLELLVISNYDEDHLADLPSILERCTPRLIWRNHSISAAALYRMKSAVSPVGPGVSAASKLLEATPPIGLEPDLGSVRLQFFSNRYGEFCDTNNLSLVTFLHYRDVHVVFPGDLERPGWKALLRRDGEFSAALKSVNFFVASHHGRESGYCDEVFDYCKPKLVIVSDEPIKYPTQQTSERYYRHASGYQVYSQAQRRSETRWVLTTRNDGRISISQGQDTFDPIVTTWF